MRGPRPISWPARSQAGGAGFGRLLRLVIACGFIIIGRAAPAQARGLTASPETKLQTFAVEGIVKKLSPDGTTVVIAHEAIPNYMPAMTMPFKVKDPAQLTGLHPGDQLRFQLKVTETESWIEGIAPVVGQASRLSAGRSAAAGPNEAEAPPAAGGTPAPPPRHPLLTYAFTNELGQAVRLADFRGQALAITFFFTRCPIPEYCPRLSRNFEEASHKLATLPGGPTNWHFLSVTFDPQHDTPPILQAYGQRYQYDPSHWSLLTGPLDKIADLARAADVQFQPAEGFINHNFRTLIIDAAGRLQMIFPTSGNLSEAIVSEILKAAAASTARPPPAAAAVEPSPTALAR